VQQPAAGSPDFPDFPATDWIFKNGENCFMNDFFKKHSDDVIVYGFGILMLVAVVVSCCIFMF